MSTVTKETFWAQIVEDPTLYGTITTDDNLFNYRSDAVWQVMNETFIANGTNFEVTKWEELLGLTSEETSLNNRKANILNHITENLPITIGILEQLIKGVVGDEDYNFEYNNDTQTLTIETKATFENTVRDLVSRVIPMNLNVEYYFPGLPAGYIEALFLETNNANQVDLNKCTHIAFNMPVDNTMTIRIKSAYLDISHRSGVFGEKTGTNRNTIALNWMMDGTYIKWLFGNSTGSNHYNLSNATLGVPCVVEVSPDGFYVDGTRKSVKNHNLTNMSEDTFYLFHMGEYYAGKVRVFSFYASIGGETKRDFVPAITKEGVPCMYDTVSKQEYTNSGVNYFIVGFDLIQARNLKNLPHTGGSLTISLPSDYTNDSKVNSALTMAKSKGWNITVQTYEANVTTNTFGMQRIWVRKTQDENGSYVDANGNRFQVEWCVEIYSPENKTPEDFGYEQFRSVESAVEYWELTPYVDPTLEEQFNITNEEQ